MTNKVSHELAPNSCSRPYHCPCGCGSHGECFLWDYEDEVDFWQRTDGALDSGSTEAEKT